MECNHERGVCYALGPVGGAGVGRDGLEVGELQWSLCNFAETGESL